MDDKGSNYNKGKRLAIVIGINEYQNGVVFTGLNKAVNDAKAMGKILKEKGEFDTVLVMTDENKQDSPLFPTRSKIINQLNEILKDAQPEDLLLFFFSGHGVTVEEKSGEEVTGEIDKTKDSAYLITYDTYKESLKETGIKVETILSTIKAKNLEKILLVMDACRDKITNEKAGNVKGLQSKEFENAKIAATFYSTQNEKVSYEDTESDFGIFTKFLVLGLEGNADENVDSVVTLDELKDYVETSVKTWSEEKISKKELKIVQHPAMRTYGDTSGKLALSLGKKSDRSKYVDTIIPRNLSPVWRSTLLPGWGQYYNGSDFKGNLMFVSLLGTAGFLASSYNNYKSAERNFQSTANSMLLFPSDPTLSSLGYMNSRSLHSEYQSRANTVSIAAGVLLFIYACNLVDSFWFSNRTSQIQAPKVSPTEPSTPDKNVGLNVNVYLQPSTQNNSYSSEKVVLLNYTWRF